MRKCSVPLPPPAPPQHEVSSSVSTGPPPHSISEFPPPEYFIILGDVLEVVVLGSDCFNWGIVDDDFVCG